MKSCPICMGEAPCFPCSNCGYEPAELDGFTAYAPDLARQAPGFDPAHYALLAELESENFWFRSRNALILWALSRYLAVSGKYLEIGCGTGYVTSAVSRFFPELTTSGSEIFVEGLSIAAKRTPSTRFFQMDARSIPYISEFDFIAAFDVIEHIDDDMTVLHQMMRSLKPGGSVILTVPQHRWLWSEQDEIAHHVRRYARGELERKLTDCGFTLRFSSSFVTLLLPALVASRKRPNPSNSAADPFREFRIPKWMNTLLLGVMAIERGFIKAGVRFPIGGSRLIIATKDKS